MTKTSFFRCLREKAHEYPLINSFKLIVRVGMSPLRGGAYYVMNIAVPVARSSSATLYPNDLRFFGIRRCRCGKTEG